MWAGGGLDKPVFLMLGPPGVVSPDAADAAADAARSDGCSGVTGAEVPPVSLALLAATAFALVLGAGRLDLGALAVLGGKLRVL